MRGLIKIESRDDMSFVSDPSKKDSLQIVKKTDIEQSSKPTKLYEEDETSIYEYDIDCLKKSGTLDRICNENKKIE